MNRPRHRRHARPRRLLVVIATLAIALVGTQGVSLIATAGTSDRDREGLFSSDTEVITEDSGGGNDAASGALPSVRDLEPQDQPEMVTICHAPEGNPDNLQDLTIPVSQIEGENGHEHHELDIIPPIPSIEFPGLNWDDVGQDIYDGGTCEGDGIPDQAGSISIDKEALLEGGLQAGDTLTYAITLTNSGGDDVFGTLTDVIPPSLHLLDYSCGSLDLQVRRPMFHIGDTVQCFVGIPGSDDGLDGQITIYVTVEVVAPCGVEISNTATFTPDQGQVPTASGRAVRVLQTAPISDTEVVSIDDCPLEVEKTASDDEVTPGESFTYTITITNPPDEGEGEGQGEPVQFGMSDLLPPGIVLDGVNASGDVSCEEGFPNVSFPPAILCEGSIPDGESVTIVITVHADGSWCGDTTNFVGVRPFILRGELAGVDEVPAPRPMTDTADVLVQCFEIDKSASPGGIAPGGSFDWVITVTDHSLYGNFLEVSDQLPANAVFDGVETTHGQCSVEGSALLCSFFLGSESGNTATITVHMHHADGCQISNTATLDLSFQEQGPFGQQTEGENGISDDGLPISDGAVVNVACPGGEEPPPPPPGVPELQLVKDGPEFAHVGDTITYTFTVTVINGIEAEGVSVVDPLCDTGPDLVSGDDGDRVLQPGETWVFECTHIVTEQDPDPLVNTAIVSGENADGDSDTDEDSTETDILHPEIDVEVEADQNSGALGDEVGFTFVVTNTGDTPLSDVTLGDEHFNDFDTQGASSAARASLSVPISDLAPGQSVSFDRELTLQLPADLSNEAIATGTDPAGATVLDVDAVALTLVAADDVEDDGDGVAFTGTSQAVIPLAGLAALLLAAGTSLVVLARRRDRRNDER